MTGTAVKDGRGDGNDSAEDDRLLPSQATFPNGVTIPLHILTFPLYHQSC